MIKENCKSADNSSINSLSSEEENILKQISQVYKQKILVPCTACRYCMLCPQGVNIPQNFACLNNVSLETSRFRRFFARRTYRKLANSKTKVNIKNPNGNATLCIKCGICLPKCPQKIDIPNELDQVKQVLGKRRAMF